MHGRAREGANTGVLVIRPSRDAYEFAREFLQKTGADERICSSGSQGFENKLIWHLTKGKGFQCLDRAYNCQANSMPHYGICKGATLASHAAYQSEIWWRGIKVLHWSGESKPWSDWNPSRHREARSYNGAHISSEQAQTVFLWIKTMNSLFNEVPSCRYFVKTFASRFQIV